MYNRHTNTSGNTRLTGTSMYKRHTKTSGKQDELAHQCIIDIQILVEIQD